MRKVILWHRFNPTNFRTCIDLISHKEILITTGNDKSASFGVISQCHDQRWCWYQQELLQPTGVSVRNLSHSSSEGRVTSEISPSTLMKERSYSEVIKSEVQKVPPSLHLTSGEHLGINWGIFDHIFVQQAVLSITDRLKGLQEGREVKKQG